MTERRRKRDKGRRIKERQPGQTKVTQRPGAAKGTGGESGQGRRQLTLFVEETESAVVCRQAKRLR